MNSFKTWDKSRKIRALGLMDDYLRKHCTPSDYDIEWVKYGAHPYQTERLEEIATDDEKFVNALWGFYLCLTTDLSWLKI
jgi:hypothetical protein